MSERGTSTQWQVLIAQAGTEPLALDAGGSKPLVVAARQTRVYSTPELFRALGEDAVDLLVVHEKLIGADPAAFLSQVRDVVSGGEVQILGVVESAESAAVAALAVWDGGDFVLASAAPDELAARVEQALLRVEAAGRRRHETSSLESFNRRQTEFLSIVSHEIRTPLSAIMSAASILMRYGRERPETVERFARVIHQECKRLTRLINNLLDLSKIEAGQTTWRFAEVAPEELLRQVQESFLALIGERNLRLEVEREAEPSTVWVDSDKMIQVLVNLVSNAVRYSPDGGTVHLRCLGGKDGGARFEVDDQGSGIPAGMEEQIFEKFQQVDASDERTGTGLGLAIARHIVDHHQGRIFAEPGRARGARLVVELPPREE